MIRCRRSNPHWLSQRHTGGSRPRAKRIGGAGLSIIVAVVSAVGLSTNRAAADGGTVQFSQTTGNYRITVMSDPTPLRVGAADLSVLVQDVQSGQFVPDGQAMITLRHAADPPLLIRHEATQSSATNKLLRSMQIDLPRSGTWQLQLELQAMAEPVVVQSTIAVAEKPPRWREAAGWIAAPFIVIGLYLLGELLAAKKAAGSRSPATLSGMVE